MADGLSNAGKAVIYLYSNAKVIFNSTGYFYAAGSYVGSTLGNQVATFTVIKGHFASTSHKYMFRSGGKANTTYVSTGSPGNRKVYYMDSYKSIATKTISGCYYYTKGV